MTDLRMNQKTQIKELITSSRKENIASIQLSLDGFSFSVLDTKKQTISSLSHFPFKHKARSPEELLEFVEGIYQQNEQLSKRPGEVKICHVNPFSSLVPAPLFDEERSRDYLKYSSKTFQNDYIVYDELTSHDMVNVYIPFVNVNNFFLEKYGSFEYRHFSSVLIESLLDTFKYSEHPHVFAHIGKGHMELLVIKEQQCQLYNSFQFETAADFIYYVLFTAEQLQLDPEKFECVLLGEVSKDDALYSMAYKYIRKVSLLENRYSYSFPKSIDEDSKRRNFTLLNNF